MTIALGDTRQLSTLPHLGLFGSVDLEQYADLLVECKSKTLNPGDTVGEMTCCAIRNRALSIIILKLDQLENFIQSYGAYTADKIFQAVSKAIQIQLRSADMTVKHDEGSRALILIGTDEAHKQKLSLNVYIML
ncbi:MAG: diguanylate cyclase [Gammaproteobacteria bacterium]